MPAGLPENEPWPSIGGMKALRTALGIVGLTALMLSSATSHQVAWAVVALIAGLAMAAAVFFELRAARRAKEAG